ncbi:MAG: NYN domain-containing protein [Candidatus Aminicenantes bacterium]|nr:NYN domain-containing protein [Candidatus Aminicenantes bacterium]
MVEQFADESRKKICLLIDGDNAQPSLLGKMLAEVAKYGLVTIRRIYGDWTTANMGGWKQALNENAIQPIQQFRYTIGKNATDSAMIIDAMDILHGHLVDGFCLVSSDSDYTRLATRIREMGFFVMGIGKEKTPRAFVNACNLFIYTENLVPKKPPREHERSSRRSGRGGRTERAEGGEPAEGGERAARLDPVPLLRGAVDMAVQEDGWANLGTIGFTLRQLDPGFDPRTYGYKQLSQLFKAHPGQFELRLEDKSGRGDIFVRLKE